MESPEVYVPLKKVFVWRPVLITALVLGVVCPLAALFAYGFTEELLIGALPLLFGVGFVIYTYLDLAAGYEKTRYEVLSDRIVHHRGGLFSDQTTNLPFRNVTQIEKTLPFLETKFFQTGHLAIHAAGSAGGKVSLVSVLEPDRLFERLEERLRENGFDLGREEIIQQEKPGIPGVLADTLAGKGNPIGFVFLALFATVSFGPMAVTMLGTLVGMALVGVVIGLLVTVGPALVVVSFLDMIRRTYTLWEGMVEYEDGFLTIRQKIIPIANLADTNIEEPFVKRIFGMADMVVSCQGASGDIHFASMPRAAVFRGNLDRLIESTERPAKVEERAPEVLGEADGFREALRGGAEVEAVTPPRLGTTQAPPRDYKPSFLSLALPGWLLVMLGLVVVGGPLVVTLEGEGLMLVAMAAFLGATVVAGWSAFTWVSTTYTLGSNSVLWAREVITNRETKEFTNEKITKLIARRSPFDRLLGTVSLEFHSIGSLEPIKFLAIAGHGKVFEELSQRFGLPRGTPEREFVPSVSFSAVMAKQSFGLIGGAVLALGLAVGAYLATNTILAAGAIVGAALLLGGWSLSFDLLHGPRCRLNLFEDHVMVRSGLITDQYTYVAYHHARNVWSTIYPGESRGEVTIDAGGTGAVASIHYLEDPQGVHDQIDGILYKRPMKNFAQNEEFQTGELGSWKPVADNALIENSIGAGVTVVGILAIPLVRYLTKLYYDRARCSLQEDRVCQWRGIFFKRFSTVLINRIDQIQTRRGFWNNALKNGVVEVYTVGSGRAELILGPHGEYQMIYEAIDGRAKRGG